MSRTILKRNGQSAKIIALFGAQQVGKSTIANHLAQCHPLIDKMSFADPLYSMARVMFPSGSLPADKEEPRPELQGKSLRVFLQKIGTEFGREQLGDRVWIDHLIDRVRWSEARIVVLDDMRFRNEYEAMREIGAMCIEVRRSGHGPVGSHASELDWQNFEADLVIEDSPGESLFRFKDRARRGIINALAGAFFRSGD